MNKTAVPVFERENVKNVDDEREASDRGEDCEAGTSQIQPKESPSSGLGELQNNEDILDATTNSITDPNSCENCEQFKNKIQLLEQQIKDMTAMHSVAVLKMDEKLAAQKETSKKYVKEKKA